MLTKRTKPHPSDLFQIPFSGVMLWNDLIQIYSDIINEMDGTVVENCLSFYYDKNMLNQVYQFRDEDSEFDMANILGIDLNVTIEGESIQDRKIRNDNDNDNLKDFKKIKAETKKAKKERRVEKLKTKPHFIVL